MGGFGWSSGIDEGLIHVKDKDVFFLLCLSSYILGDKEKVLFS